MHRYQRGDTTVNDLWECCVCYFFSALKDQTKLAHFAGFRLLLSLSIGFWNSFIKISEREWGSERSREKRELNNFENVAPVNDFFYLLLPKLQAPFSVSSVSFTCHAGRMSNLQCPYLEPLPIFPALFLYFFSAAKVRN